MMQNLNHNLTIHNEKYSWSSAMDKIRLIRIGVPKASINVVSKKANIHFKAIFCYLTIKEEEYYNNSLQTLNKKDSETILNLIEILDYGNYVFNNENEKFQRWLKKPNSYLNDIIPSSLFDSFSGIQEVRKCLNRIDFGNMA